MSPAHAGGAPDVSPICTSVVQDTSENSLLGRGSHCQKSESFERVLIGDDNRETGRVRIEAYTYSDNPLNQLSWQIRFRFRTTTLSGNGGGLQIKPVIECGSQCTVSPNAGVGLVPDSLSSETIVTITPNMKEGNPLYVRPYVEYRIVKTGDSFENGSSLTSHSGMSYVPDLRCDVDLAKIGTQGCIYLKAPAVMRSVKTDNQEVDESAKHIKEAQAKDLPGKFISRDDGTILPGSGSQALTRTRDATLRTKNRTASKDQCIAQYGRVTGQCTFTGDSNETPSDCDCDEYPFAATNEGAATGKFSVKRIDASDNRRAGAFLGDFFRAQRVLDGDEFYVDVEPGGASPASKRR
ncbi:hypothetical protein C5O80_30440 [Burkholderia sp. SRS-46]|nr:hypothetical protein C5O80_30440 [Burkholderia sp. SRS-46]